MVPPLRRGPLRAATIDLEAFVGHRVEHHDEPDLPFGGREGDDIAIVIVQLRDLGSRILPDQGGDLGDRFLDADLRCFSVRYGRSPD